jgi:hypothetical protein
MLPTAFSHKCQSLMISVVDLQGPVPPTTQVLQLLQQTEEWPCRLSWVPATATQHLNYPYFFTSPKSQENKSGKLNQWDICIYIYCTCVCVFSETSKSLCRWYKPGQSSFWQLKMRSENGIPSDSLMVNHHPLKLHVFWNPQFWDKAKYHINLVIFLQYYITSYPYKYPQFGGWFIPSLIGDLLDKPQIFIVNPHPCWLDTWALPNTPIPFIVSILL